MAANWLCEVNNLCYQVLSFLFDFKYSVVVIVSSLVSLMVDQVGSLQSRG